MSDIRQPSNVRLGRAPTAADQRQEAERTDQANITRGSSTSRVGDTTTTGLRPTQMVEDTSEARAVNERGTLTVTGRGSEGASQATTPVSRLTGSNTLDPNAAARSFIDNLHALDFAENNDSDSMTASFLKLETTNMSTNQDIEGFLNQAKHYLREAAFKIERALANQSPEALESQAQQLEQQAGQMIRDALEANGQSGGEIEAMLQELEGSGSSSGTGSSVDENTAQMWMSIYDSASRAIGDAARASQEEMNALARGDTSAAADAHARADAAEGRARTMLEAAGINISNADGEALGKLALEMQANGESGNVITKFLDLHPEKAEKLLPPEIYAQVKDQGGEAIVKAIMEHQASQIDPLSMMSIGLAANAADQQALSEMMGAFPEAGAIQGVLAQAAEMMVQAYELRMRALQMRSALLDAQNAIHEGKTDDGQFGVMRRNMVAQNEIMRGFARLTGGSRPDMQAREDANMEARRSRPQVVQLMRDMVEHDARTQLARRGTQVRT
ncbi:MAG: hypothetical protein ACAI38_05325 [Myxococcota bacterium]